VAPHPVLRAFRQEFDNVLQRDDQAVVIRRSMNNDGSAESLSRKAPEGRLTIGICADADHQMTAESDRIRQKFGDAPITLSNHLRTRLGVGARNHTEALLS
jgi:hypothetical protein